MEENILGNLVRFNTIKDKENKEILDYIQCYLENLGFSLEKRNKYLVMSYGKNKKLGFIGHSDTVEYIDGWTTDPFILTKNEDKLYGLGVCDMKGGIAAFLSALSEIDLKKLKYGIKVLITYDEEISFTGIKEIISNGIDIPEYVLIGEPTDNRLVTGCKGLFSVRIYTNGIKVHSSNPKKGKSANSNMIKLLNELEDFYKNNIEPFEDKKYEVSYTTMNIGLLNGGSAMNSVSASCMSYVDFRTISNEHVDIIQNKLNELCKKYDAIYKIDIDVKTFYNDISFLNDTYTAGFMTEASFIKGKRIILGPGPVTAHEINENITLSSLKECKKQYITLIKNICEF